jgi:hypothetical protein
LNQYVENSGSQFSNPFFNVPTELAVAHGGQIGRIFVNRKISILGNFFTEAPLGRWPNVWSLFYRKT